MSAFFIYLFKVCGWITVWWFIYLFFFRKETFYTFNRIYLMTGLAASFLIPLIRVYYPLEIFINQTLAIPEAENIQTLQHPVDIYTILFYLYIFCGAFFMIRQLFLLLKIMSRIHSSGYTIVDNCRLVDSPDTKIPFSFCNYIFINFRQIPESERQIILAHERSHINQLHWIDLFVVESIRIFLWFNPFVWLYQRSVKENHEYLADSSVINNGYSRVCYRAALINQSLNLPVFSLVNSFTSYKFKRISMMKKEISNPLKKLAVLLLIPAAGIFLWAFAEPEYRVTTIEIPQQTSNVYSPANDYEPVETPIMQKAVVRNAPAISPQDTLKSETVADDVGNWHQMLDDLATGKNQNQINITVGGERMLGEPLYIIDGKESSSAALSQYTPEQIESISVLKNASLTSIYGEKGKNGVIIITTKKNTKSSESSSDNKDNVNRTSNYYTAPVYNQRYIIDGFESDYEGFRAIDRERIESITIPKNASATPIYDEKEKNDVILITTKK